MNYMAIYGRRVRRDAWIERQYPSFPTMTEEMQRAVIKEANRATPLERHDNRREDMEGLST